MSDLLDNSENDTLTFVDEEMTYDEVKKIFGCYGEIRFINKYFDRFFIQFETPEQAKKAQSELRRNYSVAYAHAKSRPRPKKNFRAEGELIRLWNPEDLPTCGYSASRETSSDTAMVEEQVKSTARNRTSSASSRSETSRGAVNRRELAKRHENPKENIKGSGNRKEYDRESGNRKKKSKDPENRGEIGKSTENQSQRTGKQNQREKPDDPKPSTSRVQDPERDSSDGSYDNTEEPKAGKPKAGKPKARKPKSENRQPKEAEAKDDRNEKADEMIVGRPRNPAVLDQVRALSGYGRRRVRIGGLNEVLNEMGDNVTHSVIVANIPERYSLDHVYDLVEEVRPIAFSELGYSLRMRVKFCEVFVNDVADVNYLKRKLNDFVICGKQLTVMEPAEILDETRWKA